MLWTMSAATAPVAEAATVSRIPRPDRLPNIVLVAVDTLRADHLGCYGYQRPVSPNIDRLASEGVLFERCYSAASWTLPSFMSMFTGLMPEAHGVTELDGRSLSVVIETLPEQLKQRGYTCLAVVSNPCIGRQYGFARGFDTYDDFSVCREAELGALGLDDEQDSGGVNDRVTGQMVNQQAGALLDKAKASGKPFFLFVHYFDPHDSYVPPSPYDTVFDPGYRGAMDGRGLPSMRASPPSGEDLNHLIARYDGEIGYTDELVGELVAKIDSISKPGDTLIVLVSDHGEAFGEHGKLLHGNGAYREELHVPMIWRWPGVLPKGKRVSSVVSTIDLAKTLKEVARAGGPDLTQGQSLWPHLLGGAQQDRSVLSQKALPTHGWGHHLALTRGEFRLHTRFNRDLSEKGVSFELHNVSQDRLEQDNCAELNPAVALSTREELGRLWSECKEIRTYYQAKRADSKVELTEDQRRILKGLGYLK